MKKIKKFVALLAMVLTLAVSIGAVTMASETDLVNVINQPVAAEELVNPIPVEENFYIEVEPMFNSCGCGGWSCCGGQSCSVCPPRYGFLIPSRPICACTPCNSSVICPWTQRAGLCLCR